MSGRERLNKKLKQALKEVYRAPELVRKTAFLNQYRQELASIQAKYVCCDILALGQNVPKLR